MTEGSLTLVATPIGNLGDWTPRGSEAVQRADLLACEDTRVTRKLLDHLGLKVEARFISYREQNELTLSVELSEQVQAGKHIVLMADAGTPAISDPGFRLVRECRKRGLCVTAPPGPNAAITALAISGLPSDTFLYAGFLPPKAAARRRFFSEHQSAEYTVICYESCHRILKFLADAEAVLGAQRCVCVARELTKRHETVFSGPLGEVGPLVAQRSQKGEFVVLIAKASYEL